LFSIIDFLILFIGPIYILYVHSIFSFSSSPVNCISLKLHIRNIRAHINNLVIYIKLVYWMVCHSKNHTRVTAEMCHVRMSVEHVSHAGGIHEKEF
jgi:hypothetical protein